MDPAHAESVNVFQLSIFANALVPVRRHAVGIRDEVVRVFVDLPFAYVVAQHRFGMRRTHDDRVVVRDLTIGWNRIERLRYFVHRRPQRVGFQS